MGYREFLRLLTEARDRASPILGVDCWEYLEPLDGAGQRAALVWRIASRQSGTVFPNLRTAPPLPWGRAKGRSSRSRANCERGPPDSRADEREHPGLLTDAKDREESPPQFPGAD